MKYTNKNFLKLLENNDFKSQTIKYTYETTFLNQPTLASITIRTPKDLDLKQLDNFLKEEKANIEEVTGSFFTYHYNQFESYRIEHIVNVNQNGTIYKYSLNLPFIQRMLINNDKQKWIRGIKEIMETK